jgi:hypothetical protein
MPQIIFHALQRLTLCILVTNEYELLGDAIGIFFMRCKRLFMRTRYKQVRVIG